RQYFGSPRPGPMPSTFGRGPVSPMASAAGGPFPGGWRGRRASSSAERARRWRLPPWIWFPPTAIGLSDEADARAELTGHGGGPRVGTTERGLEPQARPLPDVGADRGVHRHLLRPRRARTDLLPRGVRNLQAALSRVGHPLGRRAVRDGGEPLLLPPPRAAVGRPLRRQLRALPGGQRARLPRSARRRGLSDRVLARQPGARRAHDVHRSLPG